MGKVFTVVYFCNNKSSKNKNAKMCLLFIRKMMCTIESACPVTDKKLLSNFCCYWVCHMMRGSRYLWLILDNIFKLVIVKRKYCSCHSFVLAHVGGSTQINETAPATPLLPILGRGKQVQDDQIQSFDICRPVLPLVTMASTTLPSALNDSFQQGVMLGHLAKEDKLDCCKQVL